MVRGIGAVGRGRSRDAGTLSRQRHASGTQREWAERVQKVTTPPLQDPEEGRDAGQGEDCARSADCPALEGWICLLVQGCFSVSAAMGLLW